MSILFISHSSRNNPEAVKVRDWLRDNGWNEVFLDLDPEQGLAPGQKWQEELKAAGERCAAVIVLISPDWVASRWCQTEFLVAVQLGKLIFGVLVAPTPFEDLPLELKAHFQLADVSTPAAEADGFLRLRLGLQRAGLHPDDFPWPPPKEPGRSPYRGLFALEEKDAAIFFGRDASITKGLDALRRMRDGAPERLLIVLGASGAGKSSFLKAGLLARLSRDEENFLVLPTWRPERAALTGRRGLLHALGLSAVPDAAAIGERLATLREPALARLSRLASTAGAERGGKAPTIVLPLDQAEELFAADPVEGPAALELLRALFAADSNLLAVATLRSDSFALLQGEPRLAEVPRLPFDLPRLSPSSYKEVIEGPGRLAKPPVAVEPALVERLAADLDTADALPLLAFTLERLHAGYGAEGRLALRDYEEGLGGIGGAIERAAAAALAEALRDPELPSSPAALEALARQAFIPWLLRVDAADAPPKRRVAQLAELPPAALPLVRKLVDERLLVEDVRGGEATVEVSHEAVLRHWKALGGWIAEERDRLRSLEAVLAAAQEWQGENASGSDSWLVHRGERLAEAETLLERDDYARRLGEGGRSYLAACRSREQAALEKERLSLARQRVLQRGARVAAATVAALIAIFAVFAAWQSRAANRQISLVLADDARQANAQGRYTQAARLAALAARESLLSPADPAALPALTAAAHSSSLLFEIPAHQGQVTGLAQSPDGKLWLTWGTDGQARLWDAATGAPVARRQLAGGVTGAAFSADGARVLLWAKGSLVEVWNPAAGTAVAMQNVEANAMGARLSANGKKVLWWQVDGGLRVANADSGALLASREGQLVHGASFDADGRRVLSWSEYETAVWDADSGAEITRPAQQQRRLLGAHFLPGGQRILSWNEDGISIWNAATGEPAVAIEDQELPAGEVPPTLAGTLLGGDGTRVFSWYRDDSGVLRDTSTGKTIFKHHLGRDIGGAVLSPGGDGVLSWSRDGDWLISSLLTPGRATSGRIGPDILDGVLAPDGKRWICSCGDDGWVRVIDVDNGAEIASLRLEDKVVGMAFAQGGQRAIAWGMDGGVRVLALPAPEIRRELELLEYAIGGSFIGQDVQLVVKGGAPGLRLVELATGRRTPLENAPADGVAFSRDGNRALSWEDGRARLWDPATGKVLADFAPPGGLQRVDLAGDGRRALAIQNDGTVLVWDAATGAEIFRRPAPGIGGAIFSPDGQRVLFWHAGGALRLWDAASGEGVASFDHPDGVAGVSLAPDGGRILLWYLGGRIEVRDVASGRVVASQSYVGQIGGARFSPEGRRVLSWDSLELRVWDAATGIELARRNHTGVHLAFFDAAGSRVLVSKFAGAAYIWDVGWTLPRASSEAWIDEVCEKKLRGPEIELDQPFVNRNGDRIASLSVRRISAADAVAAPILRDRVGEDVCRPPSLFDRLGALLRGAPTFSRSAGAK